MEVKRVLITGGSRGIGAECVRLFTESGFRVAFTYCKNRDAADALKKELSGRPAVFCADFSTTDRIERFVKEVREGFGEPDILINNAGVSSYGLFQKTDAGEFEYVMNVNLKAPYLLSQAFCKHMIAQKSGAIVNVSSIWGETGASMETLYSASKAALIGLTKALAKELAPSNVRVNCVCPGVTDTGMMARFSASEREEIAESIPLGRFAAPREVAETILFLASDRASYVTGQILSPNGGMLI